MPAPPPEATSRRIQWDRAVLALLRQGDAATVQDLLQLCREQAAEPAAQQAPAFWRLAATYFEALLLAFEPPTLTVKRVAARLLRLTMVSAGGEPDDDLTQTLLQGCALHGEFLEQADTWSWQVEQDLEQWSLAPGDPLAPSTGQAVANLSERAQALGLRDLALLGEHLSRLLPLAEQGGADLELARVLGEAARHWRQMLHQLAAGTPKPAQPQLLAELDALATAVERTTP